MGDLGGYYGYGADSVSNPVSYYVQDGNLKGQHPCFDEVMVRAMQDGRASLQSSETCSGKLGIKSPKCTIIRYKNDLGLSTSEAVELWATNTLVAQIRAKEGTYWNMMEAWKRLGKCTVTPPPPTGDGDGDGDGKVDVKGNGGLKGDDGNGDVSEEQLRTQSKNKMIPIIIGVVIGIIALIVIFAIIKRRTNK